MKLTAGRARLVRGVLEETAELASAPAGLVSRAREAIAFLRPRQKLRKVLPFPTRAEKQDQKRLTRRELVDLVRPQVEARADGICECGCGLPFEKTVPGRATWDEFHGRKHVTVEETWMIRADCHQRKTENDPSREHWDLRFAAHCRRHGYGFRRRFYREPVRRRA